VVELEHFDAESLKVDQVTELFSIGLDELRGILSEGAAAHNPRKQGRADGHVRAGFQANIRGKVGSGFKGCHKPECSLPAKAEGESAWSAVDLAENVIKIRVNRSPCYGEAFGFNPLRFRISPSMYSRSGL
jgi:hypothetical protein